MTPVTPTRPARWETRLRGFVEHATTQRVILALILLNAVILGLETAPSAMAAAGGLLVAMDRAILAVFVVEIAARLAVHRWAFFRDPWSVFDFLVVGIALVPATGQLAVLRALRVLRVLRILTIVPSMRRVVGALLSAIPGLSSIALVCLTSTPRRGDSERVAEAGFSAYLAKPPKRHQLLGALSAVMGEAMTLSTKES